MEEKNTREVFRDYVAGDFLNEPDEKKTPGYEDKYSHSLFVMDEALLVDALFTKYNQSFQNLLVLESLFHDIGRFEQLKTTGSFIDSELQEHYKNMLQHIYNQHLICFLLFLIPYQIH